MQPIINKFADHANNLTGLATFCSNKNDVWYFLFATRLLNINANAPNVRMFQLNSTIQVITILKNVVFVVFAILIFQYIQIQSILELTLTLLYFYVSHIVG